MKKAVFVFLVVIVIGSILGWDYLKRKDEITNPSGGAILKKGKPLERYTFEVLSKTVFTPSEISLGEVLKEEEDFVSRMFYFWVDSKKVSGLVNIPKKQGVYSVVVMFRGYVDREKYITGVGTQKAGEAFAKAGFVTLAPDFLGYGQSDKPSENAIEERFQTYVTALTLLVSIGNLNKAIESAGVTQVSVDSNKIGIWGHSNGGQIALSVLEISGRPFPTVLWAPVSRPFPYSILYYTDDFDDHGKALRRAVAKFEEDYDAEQYSLTNFFDRINAPIQLQQGGADEAVPQKWSDDLNKKLEELNKEISYFVYGGADHNLAGSAWSMAVSRNISFYRGSLEKDK